MPARHLPPIRATLSFIVLALAPQTVAAQLVVLKPETKVRITAPARQLDGNLARVVAQLGDSVTVRLAGSQSTITLRGDEITMMKVASGLRAYPGKGSAIGLGVGALVGYLKSQQCESCLVADHAWPSVVAGAVLGLPLGFIVGSIVTGDRWESAPLRVHVNPLAKGQRDAVFRASVNLGF